MRTRNFLIGWAVLLAAAFAVLFPSCKKSASSTGIVWSSSTNITISGGTNGSFSPKYDSVAVGTTITWTTNTATDHMVTSDQVGLFSSVTLSTSGQVTFSHTFNSAGDFGYHCAFHPGMTGTIRVR